MAQEPFQLLDSQKFDYGTTPSIPVADQNQTYFAYFDGVGGTGPEYIDGTAYFIKYLIDLEGNVVNPEPYTTVDSPQAVGLYNLVDNFEVGKNAIVKLIEPDPTLDEIPNAEILQGTHRIAHVGRIVPILVTETGENKQDYITTMSFGSLSTQTYTTSTTTVITNETIPNVTAQFRYEGGEYTIPGDFGPTIYNGVLLSSPAWQTVNDSTKRILSSSAQTGTRIRFKLAMYLEETWSSNTGFNYAYIRIYRNGVALGDNRSLTKNGLSQIGDGDGGVYETAWTTYFDYDANDSFEVKVKVWDDANNREVKVKGVTDGRTQTVWYVQQEIPAGTITGTTESTEVALIPNVNIATSNYFEEATNFPNTINGGYSVLTLTPELTNMWQSDFIQNLDSASAAMTFSPITIPFSDIKPGDFIRFEYRKDQIYTIYDIREIDYGSDTALTLYITPSLSTLDQPIDIDNFYLNLNHFVIYRVLNDGVYITLDVKKDAPGGAYSGILQPEFVSDELVRKYDKIIQNLTEREIIQ